MTAVRQVATSARARLTEIAAGVRRHPRVAVALALILVAGFALRADQALEPLDRLTADEQSYVKLANRIADEHRYAQDSPEGAFHWPPGAPVLFAAAKKIDATTTTSGGIAAAHWVQVLAGTAMILAAFALAALLAGLGAGLIGAVVVALYPPFVWGSASLASEPVGSLALLTALALSLWALRSQRAWRFAAAGVAFGLTALTRADLLLVAVVVAAVLVLTLRRRVAPRRAVLLGGLLLTATALTIVPWTLYASTRLDRPVAVTNGDGTALFVGTYRPGKGMMVNIQRAFADATRERTGKFSDVSPELIPADVIMKTIAERRPELSRGAALRAEGLANLERYALGDPLGYAGFVIDKEAAMWGLHSRVGRPDRDWAVQVLHFALLGLALVGLAAGVGLARRRGFGVVIATLATGAAVHALYVAHARYALPLLPVLFAAGAAGWWLAAQRAGIGHRLANLWAARRARGRERAGRERPRVAA